VHACLLRIARDAVVYYHVTAMANPDVAALRPTGGLWAGAGPSSTSIDTVRQRRHPVHSHPLRLHGHIDRLFPSQTDLSLSLCFCMHVCVCVCVRCAKHWGRTDDAEQPGAVVDNARTSGCSCAAAGSSTPTHARQYRLLPSPAGPFRCSACSPSLGRCGQRRGPRRCRRRRR
jgi:hypothetical protein